MSTTTDAITIHFDPNADLTDPYDWPWLVTDSKLPGYPPARLFDVGADATDQELRDSLRYEFETDYGALSDDEIVIDRSDSP